MNDSEHHKEDSAAAFNRIVEILKRRYTWGLESREGDESVGTPPRVVVVLGAGASLWSRLPLWNDDALKREILQEAVACFANADHFFRDAWEKLSAAIGLDDPSWTEQERRDQLLSRATLDMICSAACDYPTTRDRVIGLLQKKFAPWDHGKPSIGPPPQLSYELLAHMLKHRFIDDLVTFNFDEVLDVAVANEVANWQYEVVTSDQQVVSAIDPEKSHMIKLHGTISQPATLRFTPERTRSLSPAMINLLDKVLFGPSQVSQQPQTKRPVRLISLGYSWRDPDFAHWVLSRSDSITDITVVTLSKDDPGSLRSKDRKSGLTVLYADKLTGGKEQGSVDLLLWAIWKRLEDELKAQGFPVMPVSRHLILSYLFGPEDPGQPQPEDPLNKHEPEKRLRAELLLHALKCKGMVNVSVMAEDWRLARYVPRGIRRGSRDGDFLEGLGYFRRSSFPDVKETYFAQARDAEKFVSWFKDERDFKVGPVIEPRFDPQESVLHFDKPRAEDFLREQVNTIFSGEEVEIVPGRDNRHEWLFVSPAPLETYQELQFKTREILERDWTHLLIIAESGAWLSGGIMKDALGRVNHRMILSLETSRRACDEWQMYAARSKIVAERRKDLEKGAKWRPLAAGCHGGSTIAT